VEGVGDLAEGAGADGVEQFGKFAAPDPRSAERIRLWDLVCARGSLEKGEEMT